MCMSSKEKSIGSSGKLTAVCTKIKRCLLYIYILYALHTLQHEGKDRLEKKTGTNSEKERVLCSGAEVGIIF